jgi:catechol 1,2-dioxygenase
VNGPDGKPVAGAWSNAGTPIRRAFIRTSTRPAHSRLQPARRGRTGADGKYEFRTLMPVGYGCPPQGATQQLLDAVGRHGNRPAHVHFFVTSEGHRKLTTQFNIEGDPLIWDDFAYATREELIPHVVDKTGGAALGLKADVQGYRVRLFPDHAGAGQRQPDRQSPAREPPG